MSEGYECQDCHRQCAHRIGRPLREWSGVHGKELCWVLQAIGTQREDSAQWDCDKSTITRLSTDLTRVKAELAAAEGRVANLRLGLELVTRSIVPGRVARRALERDDALTSAAAGGGGTGT